MYVLREGVSHAQRERPTAYSLVFVYVYFDTALLLLYCRIVDLASCFHFERASKCESR